MLGLADRWRKFPAEVLEEDASVLRMLHIEKIENARRLREEEID